MRNFYGVKENSSAFCKSENSTEQSTGFFEGFKDYLSLSNNKPCDMNTVGSKHSIFYLKLKTKHMFPLFSAFYFVSPLLQIHSVLLTNYGTEDCVV